MIASTHLIGLALLLLGFSLASVLLRRSFLAVLVGVQGIFVAASLALVGFSRMRVAMGLDDPARLANAEGHALLVLVVGAAEVAVGLVMAVAFVRKRGSPNIEAASVLRW
ncbi:MAG: NADH-quinone oxidoreductase subunit K [Myxococcota bacterium]|nr:NADH-quinone oxidoreductase subunit K [Myxococcota bacterium]